MNYYDDTIELLKGVIEYADTLESLNKDQQDLISHYKHALEALKENPSPDILDELTQQLADLKEKRKHREIQDKLFRAFVLGEDVEPIQS
ncbi:hypothetical protein SAMN05444392_102255 [Seinonella peptonophila]|uniref:Uncharacterized protein n=1 Tax=Seinonella peptonophila TaxID=112248 RepID=A0A1M4V9T6_9BACL|nr:hypothetical protein [Seinonella peptonophila]SHE65766.1 hypothetical protein SAMN05444392_102255 [Seinonella peptonophila]